MPNLNKVMIMGNLTRDPEIRFTPSNTPVCQIGVAVNRTWKSQDGERQEETTFIDVEAWGRTAETINEHLRKGRPIFVEGRLKLDTWDDKEGNKRSKLKVVCETFQFVDSKGGERDEQPRGRAAASSNDGPHDPIDEEDIPF